MSELGHGEFGEVIDKFHSHNLAELGVPVEARPRRGEQHLGRHGYTLRHRSGAAIEVLLKQRAYVVKRLSSDLPADANAGKGQVTWSKYGGPVLAWQEATRRAGF
ncbi:30S ribosomal protein S6 [Durusdinium trenchii]|uniref:30S ribosomal protein S6 n=1 Tax=Durusdinium trenchii TaxID=1381693 RepID=A0ABP0KRZ6_9DINO